MATNGQLTWSDLVLIAKRTGVENWVDEQGRRGQVVLAPSTHRGRNGRMGSVVGSTRHHTGTDENFRAAEDYPTYEVVKEGRSGLKNSLSAYGLGRWFAIYVFSEFISWHAGNWSFEGITDGNGHFLGIEAEGTGARWTEFQREFYPRLVASILLFVGEGIDMMPRHADGAMPRGRKSDAANLWAEFTAQVQGYLDDPSTLTYGGSKTPPQENIMSTAIAVAPDKTCWIDDGTKIWWTNDITEVTALAKLWRIPIVPMENPEIQKVINFRTRRKAEYEASISAAVASALPGPDIDEADLAERLFEKFAPKLEDAVSLTEADIQRLLDDSEIDTVDLLARRILEGAQ